MRHLLRYVRAVFRAWRLRLYLEFYAWQYRRGGVCKRLLAFDERECSQHPTMERFRAAMVLAAIGDTVGFLNGRLEFARDLHRVHWTVRVLGGLENLSLKPLVVSDDTVMHLATAKALSTSLRSGYDCRWLTEACRTMALQYVRCMQDMQGRAPGGTTVANMSICEQFLDANPYVEFWRTPASRSKRGGGCGAAMRAVPIGLAFASGNPLLYTVAVEAARLTHNHPTGYLGAVASALFTALAMEEVPIAAWGHRLLEVVPEAMAYVKDVDGDLAEWDIQHASFFTEQWEAYLEQRGIREGRGPARFPDNYAQPEVRDEFFASVSMFGCGGASGHDAPMIAYDCLLFAVQRSGGSDLDDDDYSYLDVVDKRSWIGQTGALSMSALHTGDSDSTAILCCAWYGALFGFHGVPKKHVLQVEYASELVQVADELFELSPHKQRFIPRSSFAPAPEVLESDEVSK